MKLHVVLAILLLNVVVFAEADSTNIDTSETTISITYDAPNIVTTTAGSLPVLISTETRFGTCTIATETSDGMTEAKATCEITLPTPCHEVGYGWTPGRLTDEYVFSVWIKQIPGVCVEMLEVRPIESSAKFSGENLMFSHRINYHPFSGAISEPVSSGETLGPSGAIETTVSISNCEQIRRELRLRLDDLEMKKKVASNAGNREEYNRLLEEWKHVREKFENLDCEEQVHKVTAVVSATALCVQERLQLEDRLERLHFALQEVEEAGFSDKAQAIMDEIRAFKLKIEGLPLIERCEAIVQVDTGIEGRTIDVLRNDYADYFEKIKEVDLRIRLLDPCAKVRLLDDHIAGLKDGIDTADTNEVEAIEAKIGALVEVKDVLLKACEQIKETTVCVDFVNMRAEFKRYVDAARSGETDISTTKLQAVEWYNKFLRLERDCLTDVKEIFNEYPCMSAQVLEFELNQLTSDVGESDIIGDLYSRMKEYELTCVGARNIGDFAERAQEGIQEARLQGPGPVSEHASDVARLVGELELKKHFILADDTLSQEEKKTAVAQIEMHKASLIREVIANFKQARVSSSIRLRLAPNMLEVEGEEVDSENVVLEVPTTDEDTLEVEIKDDRVELRSKRAVITARIAIELENGILKVRGTAIKLPDEVMDILEAETGELELKEDGENPVYEGTVRKKFRLLAILPINGNVFVKADATEGDIIEMRRPWWTIFATE